MALTPTRAEDDRHRVVASTGGGWIIASESGATETASTAGVAARFKVGDAAAYADDLYALTSPAADPTGRDAAIERMASAIVSDPTWREDVQAGRLRPPAAVLAAVKAKLNAPKEQS